VYVKMAAIIYNIPEDQVTKEQRFVGKTTILGAGYGMGALRFTEQLKGMGVHMDIAEARRVIKTYREANWKINVLWRDCQNMLVELARSRSRDFGTNDIIKPVVTDHFVGIRLPSGLIMKYGDLRWQRNDKGVEFSYKTRRGRTRIYGGKVVENVCQGIARCVIAEQMLAIAKKYRPVLTVHDSIACCVPIEEATEAQTYIEACMRKTPTWAEGLPLDCESGVAKAYGDCDPDE
jgi:DNA polymerase